MPRLTKKTPKYRHHKARNRAFVEIDKKRIYLGKHDTQESRDAYDEFVAQWLANGRSLPPDPTKDKPDGKLTVTELVVAYWQYAKPYYGDSGHIAGLKSAIRRLRKMYGKDQAEDVGPKALKLLQDSMINEDLSRRYINDQIAHIKRTYKWGVGEELVHPDAFHRLQAVSGLRRGRTLAKEAPPIVPVDDADVETTLAYLPDVVADMVRIQRLTGARPGEICILRPCDLDRANEAWIYRPSKHKTQHRGRSREICLGSKAQPILSPYLLRPGDSFCFSPQESERKRRAKQHASRTVPINYGNRPGTNRVSNPKRPPSEHYNTQSYRRAIHRAVGLANESIQKEAERASTEPKLLTKWSPNQLRHTFATEVRSLYGLEAAQASLGHANAGVTEIYAERDLEKAKKISLEVG